MTKYYYAFKFTDAFTKTGVIKEAVYYIPTNLEFGVISVMAGCTVYTACHFGKKVFDNFTKKKERK